MKRPRRFQPAAVALAWTISLGAHFHARAANASAWFDVTSFGAVGDGITKCTGAVGKAIAAAGAQGGGTVYFPAGTFLTGPIHLQSHITLYLETGCILKFSAIFEDYLPMVPSRIEGIEVTNFSPLIYAQNAVDIAIQGRGTLDGQGAAWWKEWERINSAEAGTALNKYQQEFRRLNPRAAELDPGLKTGFLRPPFIQPRDCTNVLIQNVAIINSPFWTVTPLYCENVTVAAVTIQNPPSPNTDGINPDSCRNVHISNCQVSVGDDCITIKSGRDADGRRVGRPAENYTISDCTMADGHGGVVIGSETSGGVRNIAIDNCIFDGTDRGIRIKSARGRGGVVEGVRVSNIVMRNIKYEALIVTALYQNNHPEPLSERTPLFRNIRISGITGDAAVAGDFTGLAEMPLDGVTLSDIHLEAGRGISLKDARNVALHNVVINARSGPALSAARVEGLELDAVSTTVANGSVPFQFGEVKKVFVHGCSVPRGLPACFEFPANERNEMRLEGNDFRPAAVAPAKAETKR